MGQTSLNFEIEQLHLLPQTHEFFDTKNSKGISIFLCIIIFVIIGFLIWSLLAKMDDVVKTTAILRPVEDISECKSLCSGQVVFKDYEQNKKVNKGDLLLTVDVYSEENDLKILNEQKAKYNSELKLYKDLLYCIEEDSIFNEKKISSNIYSETYISEYNKLKLQIVDLQFKYDSELNMPENLKVQNRINEAKNQLEQAEYAWELGMTMVITDHHEPLDTLPDALAVIDAKRKDNTYPFRELAGVGVVFKLIQALSIKLNLDDKEYLKYLDIVCVGTISDIVPLIDENRVITKLGLMLVKQTKNIGLAELIKA